MRSLQHSVVLVGFMGAGKSTVAKCLGAFTGCDVIDVDVLIAERAGKPIPEIFRDHGENEFRKQETAAIDGLAPLPPQIIDAGGGAVLRNADSLKKLGRIVWLRGSENELWTRVENSGNRPLLDAENPRAVFSQRFAEREAIYEAVAQHVCDVDGKSPEAIASEVFAAIS